MMHINQYPAASSNPQTGPKEWSQPRGSCCPLGAQLAGTGFNGPSFHCNPELGTLGKQASRTGVGFHEEE